MFCSGLSAFVDVYRYFAFRAGEERVDPRLDSTPPDRTNRRRGRTENRDRIVSNHIISAAAEQPSRRTSRVGKREKDLCCVVSRPGTVTVSALSCLLYPLKHKKKKTTNSRGCTHFAVDTRRCKQHERRPPTTEEEGWPTTRRPNLVGISGGMGLS